MRGARTTIALRDIARAPLRPPTTEAPAPTLPATSGTALERARLCLLRLIGAVS